MTEKRYEPFIVQTVDGVVKFCALIDICKQPHYAKGLCQGHWKRLNDGKPLGPIWAHQGYPECEYDGCPRLAIAKRGGFCQHHRLQAIAGDEMRPLADYNANFTEVGRICASCGEEKPLSEYYTRNVRAKSTKCKKCFTADTYYYAGKRDTRSDGTDPLGYAENPELQQERYEAYRARALANWHRRRDNK